MLYPVTAMGERTWMAVTALLSVAVVTLTVYCLSQGITIIFMHLYYIPIILLAYRYRRQGFWGIAVLSFLYLGLVVYFHPGDPATIGGAAARTIVFIGIGALAVYLAENLERIRADLDKSQQVQQRIIRNANVWMMVLDEKGRVIEWNPAAELICGYTFDEVRGRNEIWKAIYPDRDYRRELTRRINEIISTQSQLENFTTTVTCRDGTKKTLLWNTRELPHKAGEPPLYIGVGVDITEQKRAEKEIRLQATRTRMLLELNRMKDEPFHDLFGYSLEACLRMTESEYSFVGLISQDESVMTIHSWSKGTMKECAVSDKPMHYPIASAGVWGEAIRRRSPFILNDYRSAHPAKHGYPEGHVPITRYLGVPIFDGEQIVAILAAANKPVDYDEGDVNALSTLGNHLWELVHRREAEEALKQSEERYRAFFTTSRDCVFITSVDGRFIDFNDEAVRLLGYENRQDLMGTPVSEVYEDPDERRRHLAFISEHGYSKEYPVRLRKKNGTIINTLITSVAISDEEGNTTRFQGTIRDVTEQRRAEQALKFSNLILSTQQQASIDGILVIDEAGKVLSYNRRFLEMWNIPPDALATRSDDLFLQLALDQLENPEEFLQHVRYLYAHRDLESREEITLRDGRVFDRYSAPMIAEDGRYYGRVWYFRDITNRKRAEEAIRERENLLSEVGKLARVGGLELDISTWQIHWTNEALAIFEFPEHEKPDIGEISVLFDNTDWSGLKAAIDDCIDTGNPIDMEVPLTSAKGRRLFVHVMGRKITGERVSEKLVGAIQDITELTETKLALEQSEEKFRGVAERSFELIFLSDETGKAIYVSPSVERITGFSSQEVIGRTAYEFIAREDHEAVAKHIQRVQEGFLVEKIEARIRKKNGSIAFMELSLSPIVKGGIFSGVQVIGRDVTERRRAEETLRESEEKFRRYIENAPIGIFITDEQGRWLDVNPEASTITGYSSEELLKMSIPDILPPQVFDETMEHFRRLVETGQDSIEAMFVHKSGKVRYWAVDAVKIAQNRFLGLAQDITDKKVAQERIAELLRIVNTSPAVAFLWRAEEGWPAETVSENVTQFGYTADDFLSGRITYGSIVHPDDLDRVASEVAYNSSHGIDEFIQQYRILGKGGEVFWIEDYTHIRRDDDGMVTHYEGIILDITRRMMAEKALVEEEAKRKILVDQSRDGIVILDSDGKVFEANKSFSDMLGYTRDEMNELRVWDWDYQIEPERLLEMIRTIDETGDYFETKHRRKDGTILDVEVSTNAAVFSGTKLIFCVVRNITERKQAEEALRRSEQKNVHLLEALPDMMFTISRDGVYLDFHVPDPAFLAIPEDEIRGRNISETGFSAEMAGHMMQHIIRAIETGDLQKFEYNLELPIGTHHYEARMVALNKDEVLAIVRDITEQKEMEALQKHFTEKLKQQVDERTEALNAMLDEKILLLREIHHRVKNNLQIIISLMNLQMRKADDPRLKELLLETQGRVRAMSLVHEKLYQSEDLSKINLSSYLHSLGTQLISSHGEIARKVTLHMEFDPILTDINIAIPLGLVVNELVSNAVRHAFPGEMEGNVTLRGQMSGKEITLSVADDGIGFPEGFDLRDSRTLGLHLVQTLVRQLDGRIERASVERGTKYIVVIPVKETGEKA